MNSEDFIYYNNFRNVNFQNKGHFAVSKVKKHYLRNGLPKNG